MARRIDGPWFRKGKDTWYATLGGRSVNLKVKGERNRSEAQRAWHRLMADGIVAPSEPQSTQTVPKSPAKALTVQELGDAFLAEASSRMSPGCLRNYRIFLGHLTEVGGRRVAVEVQNVELEKMAHRPDWSSTYRANFLNCISTVYRWALRHRLIASNPFTDLRKPVRQSRGVQSVVSEAEHRRLLAVADSLMRDLLTVLWVTGARPGEITGLTCEMIRKAADGVLPLADHKNAGKGKSRFLILTGEAWEVAKRRAEGKGLLFQGSRGGRLTAKAIASRMSRLCERAGLKAIAYGYRHSFATEALTRGVPDAQVAALLGHSSTTMLHKHYSHLTGQSRVLRTAAELVRPGTTPEPIQK